jgi:general stress protein 26
MPTKKRPNPRTPSKPKSGRPAMPKEYGLKGPRSGSGLIPWKRVQTRMAQARNYWIGTARPGGRPHAMPVWGVWLNETFLFSTSRSSQKARNLAHNPALVVHLESGDDVVILEGAAEAVSDPAWLAQFADAYEAKYQFRPDIQDPKNVTYALRVRTAFAWLEADFPGGATRWRF